MPFNHVVLTLVCNWPMKSKSIANVYGFLNLCLVIIDILYCIPHAGCPIKCFTILNHLIKCSADCFYWDFRFESTSKNNINVIHLESLKTLLSSFQNMFSIDHYIFLAFITPLKLPKKPGRLTSFVETTNFSLGTCSVLNALPRVLLYRSNLFQIQ